MTLLLADQGRRQNRPPIEHFAPFLPTPGSFRAAVNELVSEIGQCSPSDARYAEHMVGRRLREDELAEVLEATPDGWDATAARLMFEVRNYEPTACNATSSLASLVRITLLAQIEAVWWGRTPSYQTDSDVRDSDELIDLDELDDEGRLAFRYRHQATTLVGRAARSAERRTLPSRSPKTAGVWLPRARPRSVEWLNGVAHEFASVAPDGTPPLWLTSAARSVEHQRHLKELGYIAVLPSAHCVGYAFDIEMKWYRRFHAHRILRGLLLDRQRANQVNVIDEGQAWHVCLHPDLAGETHQVPAPRQSD